MRLWTFGRLSGVAFAFLAVAACLVARAGDDGPKTPARDGNADNIGPVGWASADGGTTGGHGGLRTTVRDPAAFEAQLTGDRPAIVEVSGTIRLPGSIRVGSNKTILGVGPDATLLGGGLYLRGVSNVIVRNLTITGSDDAVNVDRGSNHIWIDHCDFSNCKDGLVDIKAGSDLVTVSWNRFHDHHKTCLLGHSDKPEVLAADTGKLRVTYHHNVFDGTKTRHPRVRVAEPVHVFNNYYRGNEYGVASTDDAGVIVEGNVFERVEHPTFAQYGDSKEPGRLVERDNLYVDSGKPETRGAVREVKGLYPYTLDPARDVPMIVTRGAGVGKVGR
jgi:pectate lyase